MKLEFSRQVVRKYTKTKFNENPYNGSQVVPCGRTERWTDMTKLTVDWHNFAKAPKITVGITNYMTWSFPKFVLLRRRCVCETVYKDNEFAHRVR